MSPPVVIPEIQIPIQMQDDNSLKPSAAGVLLNVDDGSESDNIKVSIKIIY